MGHWYDFPVTQVLRDLTPPTPCDGEHCPRAARWVYVGDTGELYACDDHHAMAIQP